MAYNFLGGDRDQPFLLPPDLRDWLPEGHLAWFVLDVVDQLDLAPFYRQHRDDGHGHPAYDPKLLLGVLLYGYCLGVRSSRQLERRLHEDIAFRVLAANQTPDHVTIARFRARHQQTLAGFLVESLKLCAAAGMVQVGTVALDGTKLAGNAADKANRTLDQLEAEVAEILRQAAETDQHEDRLFGDACGDELPPALASKTDRLARRARPRPGWRPRRLSASSATSSGSPPVPPPLSPRASRRGSSSPGRVTRRPTPKATANTTDPDSRFLHTRKGSVQGYNAQAVTTLEQVIVAAELTQDANDLQQLEPMLQATAATLAAAGIAERPEVLLADCGYWSIANLTEIPHAPELLIPSTKHARQGRPPQGRQAVGVQERSAPRGHDHQAQQRRRQGPLRQTQGDRRAGVRPDQGGPRRPPAAGP
jgi:transposase